jgi:hypothetical protein
MLKIHVYEKTIKRQNTYVEKLIPLNAKTRV